MNRSALGGAAVVLLTSLAACGPRDPPPPAGAPIRMRLAVLGNSDSHAYHDSVTFRPGTPQRGGARRAVTFQWTEVLARLRGHAIDQGTWGVRGRSPRVARLAALAGFSVRTPRKQDFAYNLSSSGARCRDLTGSNGQLAQLMHTIDRAPEPWAGGVVLVRIGINDLGRRDVLEEVSRGGYTEAHRGNVRACTAAILTAARALQSAQPAIRVVLVGLADNGNWPPNFDLFRDSGALRRLTAMLDDFDGALRDFAARTPGVAFIEDRAWVRERWGARGPEGDPGHRTFDLAGLRVTFTQGDDLDHAFVADGHAGTVFNLLWAQRLVAVLIERFDAKLEPITPDEVEQFLRSLSG